MQSKAASSPRKTVGDGRQNSRKAFPAMTRTSLSAPRIDTTTHCQFTLIPGVYWIGTPETMLDPVSWHLALADTNHFDPMTPRTIAPTGQPIVGFRTPTGYTAVMPARHYEQRPEGVIAHALFAPTRILFNGQTLLLDDPIVDLVAMSDDTKTLQTRVDRGLFYAETTTPALPLSITPFEWEHHRHVTVPAGTYWIGDPLDNADARQWRSPEGVVHDGQSPMEEAPIVVFSTGTSNTLHGSDENVFPVTSGYIGIMPACTTPSRGGTHTYTVTEPTRFTGHNGNFRFGSIHIGNLFPAVLDLAQREATTLAA
jgi:hypothetical protein